MSESPQQQVRDTIYRASLALDEQRWDDWLELCSDEFYYAIKAFSPEISYDMIYLDGGKKDLGTMLGMLDKHNTDNSPLSRHTVVYTVDVDDDGKSASAISSFAVYQTILDGLGSHVDAGSSHLFLVGKYHDRFELNGSGAKFVERITRLDTRRLNKGSHWPI